MRGVDTHARGLTGWTPMHYAAYMGHKDVVDLLISNFADVYAIDLSCKTPLDYAILRQHLDVAGLLRSYISYK